MAVDESMSVVLEHPDSTWNVETQYKPGNTAKGANGNAPIDFRSHFDWTQRPTLRRRRRRQPVGAGLGWRRSINGADR